MDTRLLKHYEGELAFLRDMGGEFARAYPKVAARLGMEGVEVLDPYVERLLEGAAFLSARVQLELEMQVPEISSHLLEIVYPHYLNPVPSMMIAAFEPDAGGGALKDGYRLPRDTALRSRPIDGANTPCEFRTAADLTLWPLAITEAEYIDGRGSLVAAGLAKDVDARAGIRLRLKHTDGGSIAALDLDALTLFLDPRSGSAWKIHELLCSQARGLTVRSADRRDDWTAMLSQGRVTPRGFSPEEALLPTPRRSFDGYRLLQEYFAMPERFLFVELGGLKEGFSRATGSEIDLYVLLSDGDRSAAPGIQPDAFALNAVPAVNLFPKRCDRAPVRAQDTEIQIVPDRTAGLDFEVHTLLDVVGMRNDGGEDVIFMPFYSATDLTATGESWQAYYTVARRMRQRSEKEQLRGVRTSYLGSETYVSLVDRSQAPFPAAIKQLAVQALCSNRDLPLLLSAGDGGEGLLQLPKGGPIKKITMPVPPTRPRPTLAQGDRTWRLISHLSLNYLSIAEARDGAKGGAAEALRELVGLYAPLGDRVTNKQVQGILAVDSRPIVRRMSDEVLSTAVRGIEITVTMEEDSFEGASIYVLGAVLERFFRGYGSINSFTETVLATDKRGEIYRWRPATGLGRTI